MARGTVGDGPASLAQRAAEARAVGLGGDPWRARELYGEMLPAYQRVLAPDHDATLEIVGRMVYWANQVHDFAAARALCEDLYLGLVRVDGEGHVDTMDALGDLAEATGYAGDPLAACGLYERLLGVRGQVQGSLHGDTLCTMTRLAEWLGYAGRVERACDLFAGLARSLPPQAVDARRFARAHLLEWRRRLKRQRATLRKGMHGWGYEARRLWRDGIS